MNEVSKLIDRTITEVVLDSTVTSIGRYAFFDCSSLNELRFTNPVPPTINQFPWYGLKYVYVPEGSVDAYRAEFIGKVYRNEYGGTNIDPSTFVFAYQVPYWEEQSYQCEVDETDTRTGMVTVVEQDTNPTSSTYGQTRQRTYEDLTRCNPVSGFTKITSLDEATSGKYLIVDTSVNKALNASLIKSTTSTGGLNAANNFIDVTIEDDTITEDDNTLNAAADYDADNHTLSWTDSNTGTTYYLYWTGASNAKFAYNGNTSPSMSYPMEAKQINSNFTIGNSTRSLVYNTSGPRIQFYSNNNANMFANIALFKLN